VKACIKQFPKEYRKFMEDVAKTFSKSPQKVQKLKEIICHSHKEEKVLSIIKYVKTRWSSFQECLSRILEMREPLKSFFEKEKDTKKLSFFDLENTLILQLLLCLVNKVNKYIKLFQKDNLDMMSIVFILKECAITLGDFKYKILDDHENFTVIKPFMNNDEYYHKIEKFLLDQNVQETLKERTFEEFQSYFIEKHPNFQKDLLNVSEEFRAKFFELAKIFLMTALQQIKDRLPWEPSKIIILTDAFKMKNTSSIKNLQILGTYFSNVIPENELSKFNDELISLEVNGLQVKRTIKSNPGDFLVGWNQMKKNYPLTYSLARSIQTLPYSTVPIERAFSTLTDVKTIKRNKLSVESIESCLLCKQEFKDEKFCFSEDMILRYEKALKEKKKATIIQQKKNLPSSQINTVSECPPVNLSQSPEKIEIETEQEPLKNFETMFKTYMENAKVQFFNFFSSPLEMPQTETSAFHVEESRKRKGTTKLINENLKMSKYNSQTKSNFALEKDSEEIEDQSQNDKIEEETI